MEPVLFFINNFGFLTDDSGQRNLTQDWIGAKQFTSKEQVYRCSTALNEQGLMPQGFVLLEVNKTI